MYRRRAHAGGLLGAAMMVFLVAFAGSILTLLVYLSVAVLALGLLAALAGGVQYTISQGLAHRRATAATAAITAAAHRRALSPDAPTGDVVEPASAVPPLLPQDMRHPAWIAVLEGSRARRRKMIETYLAIAKRYQRYPAHVRAELGDTSEYRTAMRLIRLEFGALPEVVGEIRTHDGTMVERVYNVSVEPDRTQVFHLDRPFERVTDCRYSHVDEHLIVGITGVSDVGLLPGYTTPERGRPVRMCGHCDPPTYWTERP